MNAEQEKLIRDWFESIKKNLPAGTEIYSISENRDGKTTIVYEYGKHDYKYRDGKRHGQIEVTKDQITQINRENKLRELGL